MAYSGSGRFPIEHASKITHMKLIKDPNVQRLLSEFENTTLSKEQVIGFKSGSIDINENSDINYVIAIDGGQAIVPNNGLRYQKHIAFITFGALLIRTEDIKQMWKDPILDPRDLAKNLEDSVWFNSAALPLSGIHIPGQLVKDTIRTTVDSILHYTGLYKTLQFLVYREWDSDFELGTGDAPSFACCKCGDKIYIPKDSINFSCNSCSQPHTLSDYLGISEDVPDDWAREDSAAALRNVLETLTLFHYVRSFMNKPDILNQTLFIKDGPLLLRARLSRLIEPIRSLIKNLNVKDIPLRIIGIEKNGDLSNHINDISAHLPKAGDFFLPTTQYIIEEIQGYNYDPKLHRNRVQYGAKVVVRIGNDHILALNIPTGDYLNEPTLESLMGFQESISALPELVSYKHENALIPIVLVNSMMSIAQQPSGDILNSFVNRIIK